jgi:hypothetical protein
MLNEEPAQSQDLQMMGMLLPLGIEKGKGFQAWCRDRGPIELGGSGSACLVARTDTHVRHGLVARSAASCRWICRSARTTLSCRHFIAGGVWDAGPLETELLVQADKLVGGSDVVLVIDDTPAEYRTARLALADDLGNHQQHNRIAWRKYDPARP